ncbi:MAG: DEAD/DEAH box helicase [Hyphomicrobiales bacterium]
MTTSTFAGLGLADRLLRNLETEGYTTPTQIQEKAIPNLLQGRDLLGIAQTGTGKTAAFSLPILQMLASGRKHPMARTARALILAPTRELVIQIAESVKTYGKGLGLTSAVVMGGVSPRPQITALQKGVDILIATPGRLIDLCQGRHVNLGRVSHFVLDEADRMLDMGFIRDVRRIVQLVPRERQTLLFSATMPAEIGKLAGEILNQPVTVEIESKSVAVDRIDQRVYHLDPAAKQGLLAKLLGEPDLTRVIVFTRTKHGADRVVRQLARAGIEADAIHGNKSQGARQRCLDSFKSGRSRILVATDIASRGIDVDGVSHVINFELPNEPESYVHRIGRTARAGAEGIAISLCAPAELGSLRGIERLIRRPLTVVGDGPVRDAGRGEGRGGGKPARSGNRANANDNRSNDNRSNDNRNGQRRRRRRFRNGSAKRAA